MTLLLGTPVLGCIVAIGVALTVGLRKGGVLLSLLVVPLFIPVFNFFASSVLEAAGLMQCAYMGTTGDFRCHDGWCSNAFTPFAIAAALGLV